MAPQPHRSDPETERARVLGDLLEAEHDRLLRQARRHSERPEDAAEALGDAVVQFLRFYDGPPGVNALRWMLLVTKRCAWEFNRRARRRAEHTVMQGDEDHPELEPILRLASEGPGPAEATLRAERTRTAAVLLAELKPDERAALILVASGYSYREIAEDRGWTLTKVNRCIAEGRQRLRELGWRGRDS